MPERRFETEELYKPLTPEAEARRNIRWRRHLQNSLMAFALVGAFLVVIWAVSGMGYFWPGWIIGAFSLALFLRYTRYRRGPVSPGEFDRELQRIRDRDSGGAESVDERT